ncbi:MAG TPA: hypothetical protein VF427_11125 [Noviherbaspirillum sp.]
MATLQNTAIERPEKMFHVELVMSGTFDHSTTLRTINVLAQTPKGAKKICKWRYQRGEVKSTREAIEIPHPLFPFSY